MWKIILNEKSVMKNTGKNYKTMNPIERKIQPISKESAGKLLSSKISSGTRVPCEVCSVTVRKDWMNKHLRDRHQLGRSLNNKPIFTKVSCQHCDRKVSAAGLRKHLRITHHLTGGLQEQEAECNFCLAVLPLTQFEHHVTKGCFVRFNKEKDQ